MARAGARIVGVNCLFDPFLCLDTLRQMKEGLKAAGPITTITTMSCDL